MNRKVFIDSFSGSASELKRGHRTEADILSALARDPLVSTWDMSEHKWLRDRIYAAVDAGLVVELAQPYPWHKFALAKPSEVNQSPSNTQSVLPDTGLARRLPE